MTRSEVRRPEVARDPLGAARNLLVHGQSQIIAHEPANPIRIHLADPVALRDVNAGISSVTVGEAKPFPAMVVMIPKERIVVPTKARAPI